MRNVFIDTSGFCGFLDPTDAFHEIARGCLRRAVAESWRLVTTNYVLHESWAVIQSRLGWEAVDAWRDRMVSRCETIWVDEAIHALGEARCCQVRQRRLSLTDCVTIEVMHRRGITDVIGQDEHLSREGFRLP